MNKLQLDIINKQLAVSAEHEAHLEKVISELKLERKDNEDEITVLKAKLARGKEEGDEVRAIVPHVDGLTISEMVQKHVTELKGRISLQKETIETIEKDRAELKDKCENLKSELRLVRGMVTPVKQDKVFCVGQPIIEILAAKGEWRSDSGGGLIAASDLFGKNPYAKIVKLESELASLNDRNNCQRENLERMAKELDELKANNRYQKGYGDGFEAAKKLLLSRVMTLPERG